MRIFYFWFILFIKTLLVKSYDTLIYDGAKRVVFYISFFQGQHADQASLPYKGYQDIGEQCLITYNPKFLHEADAVLVMGQYQHQAFKFRRSNQPFVYFELESPDNSNLWTGYFNHQIVFNWTITYKLDSTIPLPSGFTKRKKIPINLTAEELNVAATKTKVVGWLVSHCSTVNKRMEYARELQRHIEVDIFGRCGEFDCRGRNENFTCISNIKQYKFYLAFENSNCKEYITEKLWRNSYNNDVVPIVMGAPKSDYERLAPPHSFIHVDDFDSPHHLAVYLHYLDKHDDRYNAFFKWKSSYDIKLIGMKPVVQAVQRVCHRLNKKPPEFWYPSLKEWWSPPVTCIRPTEDNPYGSWKKSGIS